jgi:hypothetical protein
MKQPIVMMRDIAITMYLRSAKTPTRTPLKNSHVAGETAEEEFPEV